MIVIVAAFMTVIVLFDLSCLSFVARVLRQVIEVGIYPFCRILIMKGKGSFSHFVEGLYSAFMRSLTKACVLHHFVKSRQAIGERAFIASSMALSQ